MFSVDGGEYFFLRREPRVSLGWEQVYVDRLEGLYVTAQTRRKCSAVQETEGIHKRTQRRGGEEFFLDNDSVMRLRASRGRHAVSHTTGHAVLQFIAQRVGIVYEEDREYHDMICSLLDSHWPLPQPRLSIDRIMEQAMKDSNASAHAAKCSPCCRVPTRYAA